MSLINSIRLVQFQHPLLYIKRKEVSTFNANITIGKIVKLMTNTTVKVSGNKVTVKRPASPSQSNIRPTSPAKGLKNQAHTHAKPSKSFWRKITGK